MIAQSRPGTAGAFGVFTHDCAALFRSTLLTLALGRGLEKVTQTLSVPNHTRVDGHVHQFVPQCGRNKIKNLTIEAWNVRTMLDRTNLTDRLARRTALVAQELRRYNIDIAALSEN